MWIYIACNRNTSNALQHANTGWRRMSWVTVGMQTQCSRSLWVGLEANSRQRVRRLRMPDGRVCYVDGVVPSANNDVRNVVADDWRCLRLYSSVQMIWQLLATVSSVLRPVSSTQQQPTFQLHSVHRDEISHWLVSFLTTAFTHGTRIWFSVLVDFYSILG